MHCQPVVVAGVTEQSTDMDPSGSDSTGAFSPSIPLGKDFTFPLGRDFTIILYRYYQNNIQYTVATLSD